jgi:hypothetical protein
MSPPELRGDHPATSGAGIPHHPVHVSLGAIARQGEARKRDIKATD